MSIFASPALAGKTHMDALSTIVVWCCENRLTLSPVYTYRVFAAAAKRGDFSLGDDKLFVALISENRCRVQNFVASESATQVQRKTRK